MSPGSASPGPDSDAARRHWRRQLVLSAATISVGVASMALVGQSVARERHVHHLVTLDGRRVRSDSYLVTMWPAAVAALALLAVAAVVVLHAYRVAEFTLRSRPISRGEAG